MEADFSGYATKAGLKCTDGRTIMPDAFKHQDKMTVPLVWQHGHNNPENVLGHAVLEARPDGIYAYGYFNGTVHGQSSKQLVSHGDVTFLSIYANQLIERSKQVFHGAIREVSLVLAGANPGAKIDFVALQHSDGSTEDLEDEAVIYTGIEIEHGDKEEEAVVVEHAAEDTKEDEKSDEDTVQDVYDSFSDKQKEVVLFMIGAALEAETEKSDKDLKQSADGAGESLTGNETQESTDESPKETVATETVTEEVTSSSTDTTNNEGDLNHQEGSTDMTRNVFDQNGEKPESPTLSHDQLMTIVDTAQKTGSFKEAFLSHAAAYGITDIDMLFPDAKNVTSQPELIARRTEWVKSVIDGAKHSPFARIKSLAADLTAEEARAKGYVKGTLKKDEVIKLLKRVTTPTTIYKKQKLDRDDIIDITDLDVVAWLKWEMRFMLEEELARAILIGDGREPDADDKIDEDKLRPIAWDHEMYSHPVNVAAAITPDGIIESVLRARKFYKGTGTPTFYTTDTVLTDMILIKDTTGRRVYPTEVELAAALRVSNIVVVEVMENTPDLLGVIVNMADYTIGADKGGTLSMFDDFDIDYNQYKYLMETRISGALTKPKSAVVIKKSTGAVVTPTTPVATFATNKLVIPAVTGVEYYNVTGLTTATGGGTLLTAGDKYLSKTTDVEARPAAGYSFAHNVDNDWTFAYNASPTSAPPTGAVII